jgi:hypothetical protein
MNRIQKQSWILVVSTAIAFIISCFIVAYMAFTVGFPLALKGFYFTAFGAFGYLGFIFVRKDPSRITDERDMAIRSSASKNALITSYSFLVLLILGMRFFGGPGSSVKVETLFAVVALSFAVSAITEALTFINEYGKDDE